jgi:UDP-N-acetylglucosamine--N-acetylmuramyl-(pentapeptide) pyrophosphoryl-undecaprenol N-acetylglucosamine transferase
VVSAAGQPRRDPEGSLRLLVVGGSQGARVLNDTVPRALALGGQAWEVRHQTGESTRDETAELYRQLEVPACVDAFIEDMAAAYAWADVVVCRAGAMTVSELAASGLPAIMVPFPHAIDDHQTANARFFADAGAGICVPQAELTPESLAAQLEALRADRDRLKVMARRAGELARLDAAERVAEVLLREAAI